MKELLSSTQLDERRISEACDIVDSSCAICAATDIAAPKKKVSTTHVYEALNIELQAEFVYVQIHGEKFEVLNMVEMGTRYGERALTGSRSSEEVKKAFKLVAVPLRSRHGFQCGPRAM